ncbi:MAG: glycosyltransferase [Christiangramia sp.]|uniref:glycosyltransferase n=1 Tax=Christiangramia sp. TaxID=1931228 RepID=UPI003242DCFD
MKILQLIDTLNPGGAERMALNYYRALKKRSIPSVLVVTRELGIWGEEMSENPDFYFLNKRSTFDTRALWRLKKIIKENDIDIIHAHGTSWFFAVLCKLSDSDFKLIWHDHYGNSEFLNKRPLIALKIFSGYLDGIISVNNPLKEWAREKLHFKKDIIFLPNFVIEEKTGDSVKLRGNAEHKLICIANLRPQKDHLNLLKAFDLLQKKITISLHLFGRDYNDTYSKILKQEFDKRKEVYYYEEVSNVIPYLKDAEIGVLSSKSEGLPLALIEYGLAGLAVVCTDVGECRNVTSGKAKLVPPGDSELFAKFLKSYLLYPEERMRDSKALKKRINELYSETHVVEEYLSFIERIERL